MLNEYNITNGQKTFIFITSRSRSTYVYTEHNFRNTLGFHFQGIPPFFLFRSKTLHSEYNITCIVIRGIYYLAFLGVFFSFPTNAHCFNRNEPSRRDRNKNIKKKYDKMLIIR